MIKGNRPKILNKYNSRCAYCGCKIRSETMQIDHIISKNNFRWHVINKFDMPDFLNHLTELDVNHIDNLNPACRICNRWKGVFSLEEFRTELFVQVDRLRRRSSNYRIAEKYNLVKEIKNEIVFYFEEVKKRKELKNKLK